MRQHYIDGNVGTDADGVTITLANREQRMIDQGYNRVGVHGATPTLSNSFSQDGSVNDIRVFQPSSGGKSGEGVYLDIEAEGYAQDSLFSKSLGLSPYPTANKHAGFWNDGAHTPVREGATMYPLVARTDLATPKTLRNLRTQTVPLTPVQKIKKKFGLLNYTDVLDAQGKNAIDTLKKQGYTGVNSPDYGEITSFDGSGLRAPTAIFDPRLTKLKNIGMADGGAVMQGVGSLNETARNMSRGPRGIAGYQQFAEGGELNVNLRPLDLPVDGRMSYTQTDDGGRFDSEIRKTFEGGLGSLTPSFDYSTQNSSRNRGDLVIDENGEQIGFALEGELFLKPQSEDKVRGAFAIEKSRNNTDFTFPEGEFVETREGLLKRFNLGMDLGNFGIDLNRTEASGREPINEGSATIRIGENGIVRYSDSDRGEPNIEFNYSKQFADGGPVYMKKGGEGKEESARQKILNTIYGVESNNNYDAWNTSAKNPPQKDLTSLTVKEIMDYQGNNKGPAAGAGQIKFDTLSYLINAGTLSEDDLFTAATQDIANNKLLDRRGFNSWLSGDLSDLDFGDNIASEWASIPLLSSMTTPNGVEKERGESRYGGSNKALLGADVWENVLYTAKGQSKNPQTIDEIVLAEAYTPEKLVSEVMAGSPTYMTDESSPLSMVERYPQSGPLGRVESYPQSGPLGRVESYPVDRVESYPVDRVERYPVDRVERYPDMQEVGTPQESLYEKYSPQVVQDALLGIGYLNSVSGPSATNR